MRPRHTRTSRAPSTPSSPAVTRGRRSGVCRGTTPTEWKGCAAAHLRPDATLGPLLSAVVSFEIRPTADLEEYGRAIFGIGQYFGAMPDEERLGRFTKVLDLERMHAARENGEIVGGAGAFAYDFSVPGGSLPCAGVTVVGVYPTHRRRGVLRAMMDAQLQDVHERGEPIAALWASEETIYGRFGYGLAAWAGDATISSSAAAFAQPLERKGSTRFVTLDEALKVFPPVWEELRGQRPGVFARSAAWWELRALRMPKEQEGAPKRFAVVEIDGQVEAYAIFRLHFAHEDGAFTSKTEVVEAIGMTPQATA